MKTAVQENEVLPSILENLDKMKFENDRSIRAHGFLLAVVANVIWGTSFLASKYTLAVWGPFLASTLRFVVALGVMLVALPFFGFRIQTPKTANAWMGIGLVGLTGFGFLYPLQLRGLTEIPSSLSASVMLTSPLFVLLISAGVFRESLSTRKLVAIALGIAGGILLMNPTAVLRSSWEVTSLYKLMTGSAMTLLASVSLAISALSTRVASKHIDSASLTFWSMLVGLVFLVPFAIVEPQPVPVNGVLLPGFAALLFLSIVCSTVAFLIWNKALAITSAQNIASTMHIKTPVAVILGVCIAGEKISAELVLGAALISFAVWLSQSRPKVHVSEVPYGNK